MSGRDHEAILDATDPTAAEHEYASASVTTTAHPTIPAVSIRTSGTVGDEAIMP